MSLTSDTDPEDTDVPLLQNVFTRYVDSTQGYLQAAELMKRPSLRDAFLEIAEHRGQVCLEISTLLREKGEETEEASSVEGAMHRWWIRIREAMTAEELEAVLAECIRGEEVLLGALEKALAQGEHDAGTTRILTSAATEVREAITHFKVALEIEES